MHTCYPSLGQVQEQTGLYETLPQKEKRDEWRPVCTRERSLAGWGQFPQWPYVYKRVEPGGVVSFPNGPAENRVGGQEGAPQLPSQP